MVKPNAMVIVLAYENQEVFKAALVTKKNKNNQAQDVLNDTLKQRQLVTVNTSVTCYSKPKQNNLHNTFSGCARVCSTVSGVLKN